MNTSTTRPTAARPATTRQTTTGRTLSAADSSTPARITVSGTLDYSYDSAGVYKTGSGANAVARRVLDWSPEVLERQDFIGTERGERTVMSSRYIVRVDGITHTAEMGELHDGSVWQYYPGADGAAARGLRDVLTNIVRSQGKYAPVTELVDRSGWHITRDGQRGYLYPDDHTYPPELPVRLAGRPTETTLAYCQLPTAADVQNAAELLPDMLAGLIEHAGPALIGLAAGARALATSIKHPRTSVLLDGLRGTGKSATEWLAGAYVTGWGWPILPTASFRDTAGAIETKLGARGDAALTLDDCPNGANATATQDAEANKQLEMVIRSAETGASIRDRQDRTNPRQIRESNSINGLPVISVEHLPRIMRGSLMRRCVIVKFDAVNRADTRWLKRNTDMVGRLIRAAGDRIVIYLGTADLAELTAWLTERVNTHEDHLARLVREQSADCDDSLLSIVTGAAEILAGVDVLAAALGIELPGLLAAMTDHLVTACVHTIGLATDEHLGSDDATTALADVLIKSLIGGRAHITDEMGVPGPHLPGLSPGEQGLKGSADGDWWPVGPVPLHYVDHDGTPVIAVRSASLHELVKLSADTRLAGYSALTLPGRLVESGAALPSTQKRLRGVHELRAIKGRPRVVLIRADVIDPHALRGAAGATLPDPPEGGWAGEVIAAMVSGNSDRIGTVLDQVAALPAAAIMDVITEIGSADTTELGETAADTAAIIRAMVDARRSRTAARAEVVEPEQLALPAPVATLSAPIPAPRATGEGQPKPARQQPASRLGREVEPSAGAARQVEPADCDAVVYVIDQGRAVGDPESMDVPADLPALLVTLAGGPAAEVSIMLTAPADYGLTGKKPAVNRAWHKGLEPLTALGWHAEGDPSRRPNVGAWTNMQHPDYGTVRLCVLPWLSTQDPFPYANVRTDKGQTVLEDASRVAPGELVRRSRQFAELATVTYRGTRANSAVCLFRDSIASTAHRQPRWSGTAPIEGDMDSLDWVWTTADPESVAGGALFALGFDGNKNHLYPTREVRLCFEDLKHTGPIAYDPKLAGLFRIVVPAWPYPLLPAPTSQTGRAWVTAPILKLYAQMSMDVEIVESWSGPGIQPQGSRVFVDIVANGLETCGDDDQAVEQALKGLYQTLHGKMRSKFSRIRRPDWGLAIRDESWCNTLRKVYAIAGVMVAGSATGKPPTGPVPLYVDMDEIVYPTIAATHAEACALLPGILLGSDLGQFKPKTNLNIIQWLTRKDGE